MFTIDAEDFHWIDGSADDPKDLCLHGTACAVIGEKKYVYDSAVSSTALYLLKSLTENHIMNESDNQILPCCGHFMFADNEYENVTVLGCPNGIDWSVIHNGDSVILETEDGSKECIPIEDYRNMVFMFCDKIESFYDSCSPKEFSNIENERIYHAFWNEWHRKRGK